MRRIKRTALAMGVCLAALQLTSVTPATAQEVAVERAMKDAPYWDSSLPVAQRVEDLLARMTLEEKVAQIITIWDSKGEIQGQGDDFDPAKASRRFPNGIGQIARPSDRLGPSSPREVPRRNIEDSIQYVIDGAEVGNGRNPLGHSGSLPRRIAPRLRRQGCHCLSPIDWPRQHMESRSHP